MPTKIHRSSSITRTINYLYHDNASVQRHIFSNQTRKGTKTARWQTNLFRRMETLSFTDSYYQFDEFLDSEYPFLVKENHDRTSTDSTVISACYSSISNSKSQSSNDSITSYDQCSNHHKKTIPLNKRIGRRQKKASAKVAPVASS